MPQLASKVSSRQQSIMGAPRVIGDDGITQTSARDLPKLVQPPPAPIERKPPARVAAAAVQTPATRRVETSDDSDDIMGPIEDNVPLPPSRAARFDVLKSLHVGQSRWVKLKSAALLCARLAKESGFRFSNVIVPVPRRLILANAVRPNDPHKINRSIAGFARGVTLLLDWPNGGQVLGNSRRWGETIGYASGSRYHRGLGAV